MGIVNVTDDSFSDGGLWSDPEIAVAHARSLVRDGADIVDVGGESTRPGAQRVAADQELSRVVPVVEALAGAEARSRGAAVPVSVDTMRSAVAAAAAAAGATIINDVSAGLADERMLPVCADSDVDVCLMHWRTDRFAGASGRAEPDPRGIVAEVREHLLRRVDAAVAAGIPENRIVLDPGLGFAKNADDNWALLHGLPELVATGFPVLVGASRKRFVAQVQASRGAAGTEGVGETGVAAPHPDPATVADPATAAISALSAAAGAWAVRVHEVGNSRDAVDVAASWAAGRAIDGAPADHDYR